MYWNLLGVGKSSLVILSKTARVVKTIGSENEHLGARRELKILKAVPDEGVGNMMGTSCLKNLNES